MASAVGDLGASRLALAQVDPSAAASRPHAAFLRVERVANQLASGEFEDARTALRAASVEVGTLGCAVQPLLTALGCLLRVGVGELPEAQARARLALGQSAGRHLPDEVRLELLAVEVEALFRQGRTDQARELLAREDPPAGWPDAMQWICLGAASALDPDPNQHAELTAATLRHLGRSLRPLMLLAHRGPGLVRAAVRRDDLEQARTLAGYALTIAEQADSPLWWGVAQHASGLIARDPAQLRAAIARLRATSARLALADALLDLARLPGLPTVQARAAATESAVLFGRLGATGDQERAQRRDRVLGAVKRQQPAARPRHGRDALTSSEMRVAELLVAGATKQQTADQLFVSFHTVDTHVRAIYGKLGIRSRVQLARIWDADAPRPRPADTGEEAHRLTNNAILAIR
jgi:DNA-binding CsgD family transcriptional regulator